MIKTSTKTKITCSRFLEFDAAHRVMNHESKCANIHGHRYKIEIVAEADELDSIGRVIDFSVLKAKIGTWLDQYWDHTSIIFNEDKKTIDALLSAPSNKPIFIADFNPTAENMGQYLLCKVCPDLLKGTGVKVVKVVVWETPNCKAEAVLPA